VPEIGKKREEGGRVSSTRDGKEGGREGGREGWRTEEVDLVDEVPVLVGHLEEGPITEDAGVVDDNVDAAPRVLEKRREGGREGNGQ